MKGRPRRAHDGLDLGRVDVVELLTKIGIEAKVVGAEARFSCPYPAHSFGDRNPSAFMNLHTTAFICFSCGAAGNCITLLADMRNVERGTARRWIEEKWLPEMAHIDDLAAWVERYFAEDDEDHQVIETVVINEIEYERRAVDWTEESATGWYGYMLKRDFDPEILNRFDVCYDRIADRPCITVRTPDGGLVGFKGRAWRDDQWPKYLVLGDTDRSIQTHGQRYFFHPYDAAQHVFGLHLARPHDNALIVCEGELNVISMHQKGFCNVVGPSGSTLSDRQVEDIVACCDSVTLLFDSDLKTPESATMARIKLLKAISMFDPFVSVNVCADHEGDPAEMSCDELHELVGAARSSVEYRVRHLLA